MVGDAIPEILPTNLQKLKSAYRHPFEYINPRLYQKRKYSTKSDIVVGDQLDETTNAKFFVDNEEEFQALQQQDNSGTIS